MRPDHSSLGPDLASFAAMFELSVEAAVDRIRARNPILNAFLTTRLDEALRDAAALSSAPPRSALHRSPYGLKDEWDTAGIPTTAGSIRHRDRVPKESSSVHQAFEAAGAVLVGKTNLSDMGLAPEATSYLGGPTRNPRDLQRTAGGSSGGAAAAVADGMIAFDWGSDIGGSIRMPAAFCGVYGLRLSAERWPIPAAGFFPRVPPPLAWMCGQGPITRTLGEMREVLRAAAPVRTGTARAFTLRGVALYVPDKLGEWPTFADEVRRALAAAVGGELREHTGLPNTTRVRNIYSAVWASHLEDLVASDTLTLGEGLLAVLSAVVLRGRFGDRRIHPTTAELLALVALGRYTLYRNRERALGDAQRFQGQVSELWDRGYLVAMPVCTHPAPRIGRLNYNPNILSCAVPGNLSDATGLAIPFGEFPNRMPRSIQLLGPPGSEEVLIEVAERLGRPTPA
jgi:Asp-tRNA(Asn)/Glu-tRNA(Gln) amidotransferase A subunit family amidase